MCVAEGNDEEAAKTLEKDRAKDMSKTTDLLRRDQDAIIQKNACLNPELTVIVTPVLVSKLSGLGARVVVWELTNVSQLFNFRHIVWAVNSREEYKDLINATVKEFSLATRVMGGWLAGPEWVDSCVRCSCLFESPLRLARAMRVPRELLFHSSFELKDALERICTAACTFASGGMNWTLVQSRHKLKLGMMCVKGWPNVQVQHMHALACI